MIKTLSLCTSDQTFTKDFPVGEISDQCALDDRIVWVDVTDPTGEDFTRLADEFHFHPLSIEDVRQEHQRPKIEEYPGYYFLVVYEAELKEDGSLELRELSIFLGKNFVVTVHSQQIKSIAVAERQWREWPEHGKEGSGLIAYLLIDAVVDEYLPLLDLVSDRIEDIEDHIFRKFSSEAIQEIFYSKKQLIYLRRAIAPLRDIFNRLMRREIPIFSDKTYLYFQDVFDHVLRVTDTIDTLREMLSSTMDAYLSISGNRMNLIMKRLTSISTILMSVTLISSIYGMNFMIMPETEWKYGYVFALSIMLVIGMVLFVFLRRTRWL
jgi:magnesium transporter